ncbi:Kinetochore protein mis13 [Taphrina deformans PYCC 5710]|uniref:Kinetochore protein mis13 n=1 Tax=Taphrina deformans (strain PYCC 5710 / ATCC 11124 / CBS 356.35 / IMI 108563 / JCM 9778 / NBRC 8474) TaxID=1097556 RepID=R4X933_TAPDE|nr:Kinetochore protein mis13 [Taphrina deformans PYCC 5710]|eukprot:CCG82206.1 Kinetochore protein mis13 [Taphrina deformans PYCC 5710]
MAKATATRPVTSSVGNKRKAKDEIESGTYNATKKRRQAGPLPTNNNNKNNNGSDEDDAGFTFTRPAAKAKKSTAPPTRSSPRNHPRTAPVATSATPRATKPPADSTYHGLSNGSDSFIALPVSDTPIIRKNQALRQNGGDGRRRSSLSMRGKRASSIGNGFQSLPHPDIPASEFYKHISEDLPDPVRMKQLLAWCARKSIDDSKSRPSLHGKETDEQIQAANIARTIEEEVLKDLIENKITTSWYHQPDQPLTVLEKKPHPQNVNNAAKMKEMEEKIAQLEAEERTWNELLAHHKSTSTTMDDKDTSPGATDEPQSVSGERFAKSVERAVDLDLLPAHEAEFMHSVTTRAESHVENSRVADNWLREGESNLEFQVDSLLHSLHQQQQYLKQADALSGKLLEAAARAITVAEEQGKLESHNRGIGSIDVLRQISRKS